MATASPLAREGRRPPLGELRPHRHPTGHRPHHTGSGGTLRGGAATGAAPPHWPTYRPIGSPLGRRTYGQRGASPHREPLWPKGATLSPPPGRRAFAPWPLTGHLLAKGLRPPPPPTGRLWPPLREVASPPLAREGGRPPVGQKGATPHPNGRLPTPTASPTGQRSGRHP